jgi:hypothetical protein
MEKIHKSYKGWIEGLTGAGDHDFTRSHAKLEEE